MSDINEHGVDEQLTRKVRNIAMMSKFDLSEQLDSQSTRRTVVATGVKLAYVAPIVAASLKVSTLGASAAVTGGGVICTHSLEDPGFAGCLPACTSVPGCNGNLCDGFGGPADETPGPCEDCRGGEENVCPCDNYCRPGCFTCPAGSEAATFAGCDAIC
jgi:hypothetical protein